MADTKVGKRPVGLISSGLDISNGRNLSDDGSNKSSKGKTGLKVKIRFNGAVITGASVKGPKPVNPPASPLIELGDLEATVRDIVAEVSRQGDQGVHGGLLSPLPSKWNDFIDEFRKFEQKNATVKDAYSAERTCTEDRVQGGTSDAILNEAGKANGTPVEIPVLVETSTVCKHIPQKRSSEPSEILDNSTTGKRRKLAGSPQAVTAGHSVDAPSQTNPASRCKPEADDKPDDLGPAGQRHVKRETDDKPDDLGPAGQLHVKRETDGKPNDLGPAGQLKVERETVSRLTSSPQDKVLKTLEHPGADAVTCNGRTDEDHRAQETRSDTVKASSKPTLADSGSLSPEAFGRPDNADQAVDRSALVDEDVGHTGPSRKAGKSQDVPKTVKISETSKTSDAPLAVVNDKKAVKAQKDLPDKGSGKDAGNEQSALDRQATLEEGEALPTPVKSRQNAAPRPGPREDDSNIDRARSKSLHVEADLDVNRKRKEYKDNSKDGRSRDPSKEHLREFDRSRRSDDRDRHRSDQDRHDKERDRRRDRDRDRDIDRRDRDRDRDYDRRDRNRRERRDGDRGSKEDVVDRKKGKAVESAAKHEEQQDLKRPRAAKTDEKKDGTTERQDNTVDNGTNDKSGEAGGNPFPRIDSVPMEIDTPDGQIPAMVVMITDSHEDRAIEAQRCTTVEKMSQTDMAGPSNQDGPQDGQWSSSYFRWTQSLTSSTGGLTDTTENLMAEGKKFKKLAETAKQRANGRYNAASMMFMFKSFLKFLQAAVMMEGKHSRSSVSTLLQQTACMIEHCVEPNRTSIEPEIVQEAVLLLSRRLAAIARLRALNLDRSSHKQDQISVTTALAKQKGSGETFHRPSPGDSNISSNTSAAAQGSQASGDNKAGSVKMSKDVVDSSLRCLGHMSAMMKVLEVFQRTSLQLQKFAVKAEQTQIEAGRQTAACINALGMDAACANMAMLVNLGKQAVDTVFTFAKDAETAKKGAANSASKKKS